METLGRYQIKDEIGRGGCGVVYRAIDPGIGRTVAIKTIRAGGPDERERFRREARSAGMLSHPNIVTIHEFNDSADGMFIAMEFVDGETLGERMKGQKMPIPFVLTTLRSAGDALDYAHAHNIVHRDVKPANFLITKTGGLKITDFGIAKMLDNVGLTNTGMVVGTAQYMSPEQITASEVTGRSDQFSLGVVAYEMLAGRRPFEGNSWASMMHDIMVRTPPPIAEFRAELGAPVSEVLRKVLAKDPKDRYVSCTAFVDALEGAISGASGQPPRGANASAETVEIPARPAVPPSISRLALPDTETLLMATPVVASTVPAPSAVTHEIQRPSGPKSAAKQSAVMAVGAGAAIVIGLGVWLGLRSHQPPSSEPVPTTSVTSPKQEASVPAPVVQPAAQPEPRVAASTPAPSTLPRRQTKAAEPLLPPATPASSAVSPPVPLAQAAPVPVPTAPNSAPPVVSAALPPPTAVQPPPAVTVQPAPTVVVQTPPVVAVQTAPAPPPVPQAARQPEPPPQALAPITPTVTPIPPPAKSADPAEIAARQRAAELQASRRMIAAAMNRYRQAFENKNIEALKVVWPTLGRNEQNSFQSFFRIARSIKLELTPVGDPEMTPTGAVARYRRSMVATDNRGALPAEDQTVKISFRKSGNQMLIDSIEATDR